MPAENLALEQYQNTVEGPVVQARCVLCHVNGGASGNTRLVFTAGDGQAATNYSVLQNFVATVDDGDALVLSKTQGGALHQGGAVFGTTTTEFMALESVLQLLTGNSENNTKVAMFDQVENAPPADTLRRAALILAGRLPTAQELAATQTETQLKASLRGLMAGEGFHQFLIRGANDRLLTDAFNQELNLDVIEPNASFYPTLAAKFVTANQQGEREDFYGNYYRQLRYGVAQAPLELIAYVVENDRPYTEVLTADYTLANSALAQVYNADWDNLFTADDDFSIFKVVQNRGQVLHDGEFSSEFIEGVGSVIDSHGAFVEYPHAGVLNEPAFLNRYPTTDTNRNRARARWTFYHFLGVDIEKSAARTNDPEALADTNNPTMNNANCTVCHIAMDPVAGAFQNYGDEGLYRNSWGGLDALPRVYKDGDLYERGDTWFRDVRAPGFGVLAAPSDGVYSRANSLQWLAQQIVADERFAEAAIKFWWPAVMAEELIEAPEALEDANYAEQLAAFDAQNTFIQTLADDFRVGINGGAAYNLKDMLVEMLMSPWFRAQQSTAPLEQNQRVMLAGVGTGRLLTPEELEAKTSALLGYAWGESEAPWLLDNHYTQLLDRYLIYYGGMDSFGITSRARELNTLMSNVALTQAVSVACGAVVLDFNRTPAPSLFSMVDRYVTPVSHGSALAAVTGTATAASSEHMLSVGIPAGEQRLNLRFANPHWDGDLQEGTNLIITSVQIRNSSGAVVLDLAGDALSAVDGVIFTTNDQGNPTGGRFYDNAAAAYTGTILWSGGVSIPVVLPADDNYTVSVAAWRRNVPGYPVNMVVSVDALAPYSQSAGEQLLREQLVRLHQLFLGQALSTDSLEIEASYQLLVDTWQWRQANMPERAYDWETEGCDIPIPNWWQQDWTSELADTRYMQGTWISMLIYFMTDYHYLHE
ncbi:hypothetical protein MARGE09_P3908 [Marinagarivorans cellulosilyticus]|uniref:DUF1588 domain-containing protein n=1 Tax=Marinagarivorans cellulosilyticus TaxID=2721545 RepID=A0AAN2BM40_9GAMM|nr:hypothetical protein MARGE09_P3908 [Marinagarivorans cellulosilyticus]